MTQTIRRFGLGIGAALMALGLVAGVYAYGQNTNDPARPFMGRMGPGGGPGGPRQGMLGPLRMIVSQLGLSGAQQDQIKSIAQAHREEWKALRDRENAARQALIAAVTGDHVDEAAIRQRSAELGAVQADDAVARARAYAEVFQVLTPDQQAKAKTIQAQLTERMKTRQQRADQRHGGAR